LIRVQLFLSKYHESLAATIFSYNLLTVEVTEIGRYDEGSDGILFFFRIGKLIEHFQIFGMTFESHDSLKRDKR